MMSLPVWLDLFATAVFAASGALAAAGQRQTFVTFCFFALVTGVGGGTVRDLLIGVPVFWVQDWRVPVICISAAFAIWFTPARWWQGRALDWFDAAGLAAYAVFGAAKTLGLGINPISAILMGVITSCVGGIIRDVLAGTPSIIMRPEIYVSAAALAATLFVLLVSMGTPLPLAGLIGAAAGFGLRALAIARGWAIPPYNR
jgi:uncharacterized membrane protein YeiH